MKKIVVIFLVVLFLVAAVNCFAANNYYVSNAGNNSNAGTATGTSWQTLSKINGFTFANGDTINFNKNDVWNEQLIPPRDGLYFRYYGSGALPTISGFSITSSWINDGGGIWHSTVSAVNSRLINVVIDGVIQRMGRTPNWDASNSGYYQNTAGSSTTVTGPALSSTINWTGAEVVIRKYHWILDRCAVTAHSGGVVTYTNPSVAPEISSYAAKPGFGYFFQNDLRAVDQFGEWFLNTSTKNLSMYFGAATPSSYTIKASVIDTLVVGGGRNNLIFDGIAFEGANINAIGFGFGQNNKIINCTFNNNYNGIKASFLNATINNNTFTNTLDNPIKIADWGTGFTGAITISNNTIRNFGMLTGMSGSGDGFNVGIGYTGYDAKIEYNVIDTSGYLPIAWTGSRDTIRYNYITNYCITKDDGAGIYNQSLGATNTGNDVSFNTIKYGIGATNGTPNFTTPGSTYDAHGIYCDNEANGNYVHDNNISDLSQGHGIFNNSGWSNIFRNNTIYNVRIGLEITRSSGTHWVRGLTVATNVFYNNISNIDYWNGSESLAIQTDIQNTFTKLDSNYYRDAAITAPFVYYYHDTITGSFHGNFNLSLASWKTFTTKDVNSTVINTATAYYQSNATAATVPFNFATLSRKDVYGTAYNNSYNISPWLSALLFANGAAPLTNNIIYGIWR